MTGKKISVRGGSTAGGGRGGRGGGGMGGGNANSITLTVSGSPDDLETGLQLAHLLLTEPKVEPAAFSQFTTMIRTMLQQIEKNPMMVGMQAVSGAPYPEDVARTQPLKIEQVDRLDVAAAQAQLDRLIQHSPLEVTVVGDLSKDRALELVAQYLGSLPPRDRVSPDVVCRSAEVAAPGRAADDQPDDRVRDAAGIRLRGVLRSR